jgi:hypothetical protein
MDSGPTTDVQHLQLLRIFHYIWGGFCCLLGLIAIVYIRFGEAILKSFERVRSPAGENLPLMFGQFFIVASVFDFVMLESVGVLSLITAGRYGSKTRLSAMLRSINFQLHLDADRDGVRSVCAVRFVSSVSKGSF